ncbi:MAG: hypothetical protein OEN20_05740 [Gammaproteobacteria bacterium]|nr:hypothetical protein [Gammaproteobacteria bacterium]
MSPDRFPQRRWRPANIRERICFSNEVVDIREDGESSPQPATHFK